MKAITLKKGTLYRCIIILYLLFIQRIINIPLLYI